MDTELSGADVLELRPFRYVLALVELRSFRRAGAALAIPPRVLLREINAVERALGARLFERLPRTAVPTTAGREIAECARQLLARRVAAAQEAAPAEVALSVGWLDFGRGQAIQRAAVAEFQAHHPYVPVQLAPTTFNEQVHDVADGTLAVGFCAGPKPTRTGLASELLFPEAVDCALLPAGHRLADVDVLSLSDLSGIPLHTVCTDDAPELVPALLEALSRGGWHGRQTPGSPLPSQVTTMVACGVGWAPGPSSLLGWAPAGVAVRPLADGSLVDFDLHIVWREADPLAAAFVQTTLELRDLIEAAVDPPPSPHAGGGKSEYRTLLAQQHAERARIGRELHDTLLQDVLGSGLELEALRRRLPPSLEGERAVLGQVVTRLGQAARSGREVVGDLRAAGSNPRDLSLALSSLAEELREATPLEFRMRTDGTPRELRADVEETAYRVGSEAITNAFRHASATFVSVWLEYWDDLFHLRVSDNGTGIEPEVLRVGGRPGHFGLAIMRERAMEAGATLTVQSDPGAGTMVDLVVPGHTAYAMLRD